MSDKEKEINNDKELKSFLVNQGYNFVALRKVISGHLTLEVKINGIIGYFILDTGAGATVVELTQINKFKLEVEDIDETGIGAGGEISNLKRSDNNHLAIEDFENEYFTLMVLNLSHVNNKLEELGIPFIDGVIGADILTASKAIIDYENLILFLKDES